MNHEELRTSENGFDYFVYMDHDYTPDEGDPELGEAFEDGELKAFVVVKKVLATCACCWVKGYHLVDSIYPVVAPNEFKAHDIAKERMERRKDST